MQKNRSRNGILQKKCLSGKGENERPIDPKGKRGGREKQAGGDGKTVGSPPRKMKGRLEGRGRMQGTN